MKFDDKWYEARLAEFREPLDREFPNSPETNRFLAERRVEALIENDDEGDRSPADASQSANID